MSFEGFDEFLCPNGHYWNQDVFDPPEPVCPHCEQYQVWNHVVDQTNGVVTMEDGSPHPSTVPYPLEEYSYEDIWKEDHYGNQYAQKRILYKIPDD